VDELYALAIVGAGLSALSALQAGLSSEQTIIIDYQERPGGFLRPALPAFSFEAFADEIARADALLARATLCLCTTAVGLLPAFAADEPHTLIVRQRSGTREIRATRVLLACGGLEETREHAQIPGPRPAGVITPIFAHQLLNRGYLPGQRVVVYGDSRYTLATAQRLALVGVAVTLINSHASTASLVDAPSALTLLAPARLVALDGFPRLEQLTFERAGEFFSLSADTLIYGAGMRANTHWLKGSGLVLGAQGALEIDQHYQTSVPGIYAMGTIVSPSLDHTSSSKMGKEVAALLSGGSL
jgi:thioredoxin reductase